MKKYLTTLLAACCMLAAFSMPASALEYHFDGPDAGLFGRPTSDDTIYVTMDKPANTDRSKNAAYIPPAFGSPTSYTLNAGELLTPNLVSSSATGTVSSTGGVTVLPPSISSSTAGGNTGSYTPVKYTAVTKDLYYSGGYLGTLKIPTLGLSRCIRGRMRTRSARARAILPAPPFGKAMWRLRATIAASTITLAKFTPFTLATPSS